METLMFSRAPATSSENVTIEVRRNRFMPDSENVVERIPEENREQQANSETENTVRNFLFLRKIRKKRFNFNLTLLDQN